MESSLVIIEEDEEPLYMVNDKKVKNKARTTLPDVLYISILSDCTLQFGVFTKCRIPYRTQFGPLDAPLTSYFTAKSSPFLMRAKSPIVENDQRDFTNGLYYDTSDESNCNWMCMVRPATCFEDQNMAAHFVDHAVYFTTTRRIDVAEELKVWYAPKYAQLMKKRLFTPSITVTDVCADNASNEIENLNILRPHQQSPKSSKLMNFEFKYFEEEDDVDVRSVPPKKRGWKRANQHFNKLQSIDGAYMISDPLQDNHDRKLLALPSNEQSVVENELVITVNNGSSLEAPKRTTDKIYICPDCGKTFGRKYTLKMHSTTHSNSYDYLCHTCGKGYKRKDKLGEHIKRVHLSSKPIKERRRRTEPRFVPRLKPQDFEKFLFKCLRCSLGFHRRGMLVNHLVKKHPDIDIKSVPELSIPLFKKDILFMCLYCNKSYKSNSKRKRHIEKHHPGEIMPPSLRQTNSMESNTEPSGIESKGLIAMEPVMCPYCQSQYTTRSKLNKHISIKHPDKLSCVVATQQSQRKKTPTLKGKEDLDDPERMKMKLSKKHKRWRCVMKKNSSEESVPSDQDSTDLASVDNILMLSNVPPNSFIGNENVAADSTQLVCESAYMESQPSSLSDMVNSSMVDLNQPSDYTGQSVVPIPTSYGGEQGISHIAEVEVEETDDDRMNEIMIELNPEVTEHPVSSTMEQHQIQTSNMQENVATVDQSYEKSTRQPTYDYQQNSVQQPRPLPRGRKQFLHTYNEERQSSQSLDRPCHRYDTRMSNNRQSEYPVVEISYNNRNGNEHQYSDITQGNQACQTSMALTSLSSCDMSWMY